MEELIGDMLELTQQEGGIGTTRRLPIEEVATETGGWVETRDAELAVEAPGSIDADRSRLASLLENLFRNAVKHGGRGVTGRVGALEDSDGFYVEDTGEGIPEDVRAEVFDKGYTTTPEGTGLGISIVEEVTNAHGWNAEIGKGEEGGARFEFRT